MRKSRGISTAWSQSANSWKTTTKCLRQVHKSQISMEGLSLWGKETVWQWKDLVLRRVRKFSMTRSRALQRNQIAKVLAAVEWVIPTLKVRSLTTRVLEVGSLMSRATDLLALMIWPRSKMTMTCLSTAVKKRTSWTGNKFSSRRRWWVSLNRSLSPSSTSWWMRQSTKKLSTSLVLVVKTWLLSTFSNTWLWCHWLTPNTSQSQVPWVRGMITTTLWLCSSVSFGSGPMHMLLSGSHTTLQLWCLALTSVLSQCSSTQSESRSEMWRSSRTLRSLSRFSRVSSLIRKFPLLSLTLHRSSRWRAALVSHGYCSRWPLERRSSSTMIPFSSRFQSWSWLSFKSTQHSSEIGSRPAMISSRPIVTATSSSCWLSLWLIIEDFCSDE